MQNLGRFPSLDFFQPLLQLRIRSYSLYYAIKYGNHTILLLLNSQAGMMKMMITSPVSATVNISSANIASRNNSFVSCLCLSRLSLTSTLNCVLFPVVTALNYRKRTSINLVCWLSMCYFFSLI